jgi:hypothetical protein
MRSTRRAPGSWRRSILIGTGAAALAWFLVRVVPKPSRASYPCQRAAFPVASAFAIWLVGTLSIRSLFARLGGALSRRRAAAALGIASVLGVAGWTLVTLVYPGLAGPQEKVTDFNFIPAKANTPVGVARGIYPGRVVWARDPLATKWAGHLHWTSDQWWLDQNTDQKAVDAMLDATLSRLTGAPGGEQAWQALFQYYNSHSRQLAGRGYRPGEVVAVKINMNNATGSAKVDNFIDSSPQMVLAMVRQLVNQAHVRPQDIVVYDARRYMMPYTLTKVWSEFKDVRFLQSGPAKEDQPKHPVYGDYSRLEAPVWVEGVTYSNGKYDEARLIPKQIYDATYLVNMALLKAHSYPYNDLDGGDNGQTGITMTSKNHFGSIKGTPELHAAINTDQEGVKNAYSPVVDLAASPNLGAKTVLFVLDGLYCGRKWQSYPQHFPNFPFNNRAIPYESPEWPSSVLASMDGVALDSVGLDLLFAQTKNNNDELGRPRILIRANADDYLFEMAQPGNSPSGTVYKQGGKVVASLGAHERWENDSTMRYSRNIDPVNGKGIELVYLPMGGARDKPADLAFAASLAKPVQRTPMAPAKLPGAGLAQHDFFYAGEAKEERMFIVRNGQVVWSYTHPGKGEISDAVRLSSGNVLFAHQFGVTEVTPEKKVVWNYDAPPGTEIHTAQPIGKDRVLFIQNGDPARLIVMEKSRGFVEREFVLPTGNPKSVHGQFRHARLTREGTLLVAHMDAGKVCEYNSDGRLVWSIASPNPWGAVELDNGNVLIAGGRQSVREVNRKGETVWEFSAGDAPEYKLYSVQLATRLPDGNTIVNSWFNQWDGTVDADNAPVQAIEVTPQKKVVWALRSWTPPADLGPATIVQLLNDKDVPEKVTFGDIQ